MSKFKLFVLLFISLIIALSGFTQRHALACEFIAYTSYSEIAPNIFASASFNHHQHRKLLSIIDSGKSRVNNTFGNMISFPKVIIAATEDEASEFGSNAHGKALLTPLGQCIVFGPRGQNVDVIAHEYTHAEVHFRVGWFYHLLNVPIWFNEGVALLVDFRKPYLLENISLSQDEINSVKNNKFNFSISSYKASKILVDGIDKSKFYGNLEKLRQGQGINSVFTL